MIEDFLVQIRYAPRALLLGFLFIFTFMFIEDNKLNWKNRIKTFLKRKWLVAFLLYSAFIWMSTLIARQYINPYKNIFDGFLGGSDEKWMNEIIENILLYIPFSFLLLKAFQAKRPWLVALIASVLTTTTIELLQLLLWLGYFQLADILYNTIGGMLGSVIWYLVKTGKDEYLWLKKQEKRRR